MRFNFFNLQRREDKIDLHSLWTLLYSTLHHLLLKLEEWELTWIWFLQFQIEKVTILEEPQSIDMLMFLKIRLKNIDHLLRTLDLHPRDGLNTKSLKFTKNMNSIEADHQQEILFVNSTIKSNLLKRSCLQLRDLNRWRTPMSPTHMQFRIEIQLENFFIQFLQLRLT